MELSGTSAKKPLASATLGHAALLAVLTAAVGLAMAGFSSSAMTTTVINVLVTLVAVVALSTFSGNSGILSFGHAAFMAIGAQISATLTMAPRLKTRLLPDLPDFLHTLQLDFWTAAIITIVIAMLVALVIGFGLMRLPAIAFSLSTLGVLIIVNSMMTASGGITRGNQAMHSIPRETTIWVAAICAAVTIFVAYIYKHSLIGLELRASREDEAAARSLGIDVARQRLFSWVLSAGMAALAGALLAHHLTVFTPKTFYLHLSFSLIVMMIFGGISSISGAVAGTIIVSIITEVVRHFENGFDLGFVEIPHLFGLTQIALSVIILITLFRFPKGITAGREIGELFRKKLPETTPAGSGSVVAHAVLEASDVSKSYGGVTALDKVSFSVSSDEILGLIGPNGSGKSTLLACLSGTHELSGGHVRFNESDITGLPPHRIAAMGIARTFQTVRMFSELTVLENVVAGIAARLGKHNGDPEAEALALLNELRIADLAALPSADLAYGQSRRVEIARALALNPSFLLVDEPAAGMNEAETEDLLQVLRKICAERGLGLIIVDHDMHLIMRLCSRLIVLNKGQLIADGPPETVRTNPLVREAYLGTARETAAQ